MKARTRSRCVWFGVSFFACFCFLLRPASAQLLGLNLVPQKIVIRLNPQADINGINRDYKTTVSDQVPGTQIYGLTLSSGTDLLQLLLRLLFDPRVVYAEPDVYLTECSSNPFTFAYDSGSPPGNYASQPAYQLVDLGNSHYWSTGAGVVVAVLDTGAKLDHPALAGHLTTGYNAIQPGQPPLDVPDGTNNHGVGHGTFISGILAQVAPGAAIMPVRVLNGDGVGTLLNVVKGLLYAATHGARVINMSFGALTHLPALLDAIHTVRGLGVVLVAAAGNDNTVEAQYPAISPDVLAVASVESNNTKASYSNYGAHIALVAPGTAVRSTYWTGGYVTWSGTSFAAPFIAAEAVLLLGLKSHPSTYTVVNAMFATAHDVDSINSNYQGQLGEGMIDIQAAVNQLR
jgi:thermitase